MMPDLSDKVSELLPCPFCGGPAMFYRLNYGGSPWVIRCNAVECAVKPFASFGDDFNEAAAWNRRTRPAASTMEGWRLVPETATDEMRRAGAIVQAAGKSGYTNAQGTWSAMLAAAPIPPEVSKP